MFPPEMFFGGKVLPLSHDEIHPACDVRATAGDAASRYSATRQ